MRNINIISAADDLVFMKSVFDKFSGAKNTFLTGKRSAVENALDTYAKNIISGTANPLGLTKGQKATKAVKAVKAKLGMAAAPSIPGKPAKKNEHEYYYDLYDSTSKLIAGEKKN